MTATELDAIKGLHCPLCLTPLVTAKERGIPAGIFDTACGNGHSILMRRTGWRAGYSIVAQGIRRPVARCDAAGRIA